MAGCLAQNHHVFTCSSSKHSMNNTYYLKQSHLFFKGADFSGLSSLLKVKRENKKMVPIATSTTTMAHQQQSVVIDSKYCKQYPEELTIARNGVEDCVVSNLVNKSIDFYLKPKPDINYLIHGDMVIYDSANKKPLLTIHKKMKDALFDYRGNSTDDKDFLFSVKKSIIEHFSTVELHVFLPYNNIEEVCDFKITGGWLDEKPWDVYMGDKTIAQIIFSKGKLMLYVHPYIDHAFIVALSMIAIEMDCLQAQSATKYSYKSQIQTSIRMLGTHINSGHPFNVNSIPC